MITRRDAILSSLAGYALPWTGAVGAGPAGFPESNYTNATVIDGLGSPGGLDPARSDNGNWSAQDLADVRASGVTALSITVNEVGNAPGRFDRAVEGIAGVEREIASHPDHFFKVLRAKDIGDAKASNRLGLIFDFQDSSMLEGDLTRLATFYDLGVRIAQPTYNRRNLIGDGCLETANGGLSRLGHEFVDEINRLQMLLDLSHAGPRTISEGIVASKAPMAITHTGCRALVDVPRNTSDDSLKALADRGGVAVIYFMPFLRVAGQPHADDLIRHLEHAVDVCGEDHVGLGTDGFISRIEINAAFAEAQRKVFEERTKAGIAAPGEAPDVFNLVPEYNDPRRFKTLADDLARRGWTVGRIEKILGRNFARLFGDVWKA